MQYLNAQKSPILLTRSEVIDLTHKMTRKAQIIALRQMGIDHKVRPDGTVVILRSHVEKVLGGGISNNARIEIQPNWSAINGKKEKPGK